MRAISRCCVVVVALLGCDDPPDDAPPWGRPALPRVIEVDPVVADLGRLLFYDPVLSSDGETACATCHSELWGMSDGMPTSIGVGGGLLTGPGRKGGTPMTRNAPTLWNVAWRETLFLDGRDTTLEHQVSAPMDSPIELGRSIVDALAELRSIPEYVALFEDAFSDDAEPLNERNLRRALADFQRTLVSDDSLYDAFAAGDSDALSAQMREGMVLFDSLSCNDCHRAPTFDSEAFYDRGIGDRVDRGRAVVSGDAADAFAFRVPTLRNVRATEPYFHDGSVASLDDAIRHEVARSGSEALTEAEHAALMAFIGRALVDRSREPDRPEQVPSGLPVPIDGFRIPRP